MTLFAAVAERSILALGLLLLVLQLIAHGVGYWAGRLASRRADSAPESVGVVVGGMLGLLAFVLALTLSFANSRFSERRAGTLAEANAIGTAWLRAEAIDHPRGREIAHLLEDYTQVRKDFVQAGLDPARLQQLNDRTNALQTQMWGHLAGIVRERPDPVSASLMAALNDTFDASTAERFAFSLRLPPQVFWLLLGMTLLSMAALGYQLGLRGKPVPVLIVLLTIMWTAVIVDILDLASARIGLLRTPAIGYDWTLQGISGDVTVPPLPRAP